LTGSSAIFGDNEFSTDVAITLGTAAVADMKRNGIGLGSENCLLAWTDKFVSDYAGNFAPPQWDSGIEGYAPLVPSVFTADASQPTLQKWFMDRESFDLYITFDEPVTITDGALIEVFRSATGQRLVAGTGTLMTGATSVPLSGTNTIVVTVPRVCSGGSCEDGESSQIDAIVAGDELLWLAIAEGAVQDTSLRESPNVAVVPAAAKAEGEFCGECDDGYYTVKQCTSNQDRVCRACTVCGIGQYESVACTADQDTRCAICNACPYGTWMSTPCAGADDVVCSACTVCAGNEFETGVCGGTSDTVCASCNTCTLPSKAADLKCSAGQYQVRDSDPHTLIYFLVIPSVIIPRVKLSTPHSQSAIAPDASTNTTHIHIHTHTHSTTTTRTAASMCSVRRSHATVHHTPTSVPPPSAVRTTGCSQTPVRPSRGIRSGLISQSADARHKHKHRHRHKLRVTAHILVECKEHIIESH